MDKEAKRNIKEHIEDVASNEPNQKVIDQLVRFRNDEDLNDLLAEEWTKTSNKDQFHINKEENWNEIIAHVEKNQRTKSLSIFSKRIYKIAIAASFALIVLSFVFQNLYPELSSPDITDSQVSYVTKKTNKGEKLNVSLPDGSTIRLNSSSELKIPSNYASAADRVVILDGEAFFSVAKFENKPFRVISDGIITEVLGTKFNVNSKRENGNVAVAVVSGRVQVNTKRSKIILEPNELTEVRVESINLKKSECDIEVVTGWRNNLLIFKKTPFGEVIEGLEEWYGVEFVIEGQPNIDDKYSGRFENSSLQVVLEGLGFSSSFDFEIKNKKVYLKF